MGLGSGLRRLVRRITSHLTVPRSVVASALSFLGVFVALSVLTANVAVPPSNADQTSIGLPGAPAIVVVQPSDGTLTITFDPPGYPGTEPITAYQYSTDDGVTYATRAIGTFESPLVLTTTSDDRTALVNGVTYHLRIRAISSLGHGGPSNGVAAIPSAVPGAPLAVTTVPGAGEVLVGWDPPTTDGGTPVTSYTATSWPDGRTCVLTVTAAVPLACTVTGLGSATASTFTVVATNLAGDSLPSLPSDPILPAAVTDLDLVGIETNPNLTAAAVDPTGDFGYFSTASGVLIKVDLADLEVVGAFYSGFVGTSGLAIDGEARHLYFSTDTIGASSTVGRVDLDDFGVQGVESITIDRQRLGGPTLIDPSGTFAYFGQFMPDASVVRVDLAAFSLDGVTIRDHVSPRRLKAAVIDPTGTFAYFGEWSGGAAGNGVVRVPLAEFVDGEVVTAALKGPDGTDQDYDLVAGVLAPDGAHAYVGVTRNLPGTDNGGRAGGVAKIDLSTFAWVSTGELPVIENSLLSAVIDTDGRFAYFGESDDPDGRIVKVDLHNDSSAAPERVGTLRTGVPGPRALAIDPGDEYLYLGTRTREPGAVVRVRLVDQDPSRAGRPVLTTVTARGSELDAAFMPPEDTGGHPPTGYQYSTDAGLTWRDRDEGDTASPLRIDAVSGDGTPLVAGTAYRVRVRAVTAAGPGYGSNTVTGLLPVVPDAPVDPFGVIGDAEVQVSWDAPAFDGGSPIIGYTVTAAPGAGSCTTTGSRTCTVTGLTNGQPHTFTVVATNAVGDSAPSVASAGVTPVATPPPFPTGIDAFAGIASATVSWIAPSGGTAPIGYRVQVRALSRDGIEPDGEFTTAAAGCAPGVTELTATTTCVAGGLVGGTPYDFRVAAVRADGTGPFSAPGPNFTVHTFTAAGTFTVTQAGPADVLVVAGGGGGGATNGNEGGGGGGGGGVLSRSGWITSTGSFAVTVGDGGFGAERSRQPGETGRDSSVAGFVARGGGGGGGGHAGQGRPQGADGGSGGGSSGPEADRPGGSATQTDVSGALGFGHGGGAGRWIAAAPGNGNGGGGGGAGTVGADGRSRLAGSVGGGGEPAMFATSGTALRYAAGGAGGPGSAPDFDNDDNAAPGTGNGGGGGGGLGGADGASGIVVVRYRTGAVVGVGGDTSVRTSVTPLAAEVPYPPTRLVGVGGDRRVTLSWHPPTFDGGGPITTYLVTAVPVDPPPDLDSSDRTCFTMGALSCTIDGLTNGQPYTFTVVATNVAGDSMPSAPSDPITPGVVPDAPTGVVAAVPVSMTPATLTVSWVAPDFTGNQPLTGYRVLQRLAPDGPWTEPTGGCSFASTGGSVATSCTTIGLSAAPYEFRVAAINTNVDGQGPFSVPSPAATPVAPPAPSAPGAPAISGGVPGDRQVTLSWTAPTSDGGLPLSDYYVQVYDAAGGAPSGVTGGAGRFVGSTATSFVFDGLTNGTGYTFTVAAANAAKLGPASQRGPGLVRHVFTGSGTFSVSQSQVGATLSYALVGGGGGGGGGTCNAFYPAGGGGGAVVTGTTTAATRAITVGAGGATQTYSQCGVGPVGLSGAASSLAGVATAAGGNGGLVAQGGTSGSGQIGGTTYPSGPGGSGGGGGDQVAGQSGVGKVAGAGGDGQDLSTVWGTDVGDAGWFGGGGGGSQGDGNGTGGAGGRGGGGRGQSGSQGIVATSGAPNTGGGGSLRLGGGSGVVLIGYQQGTVTATGGTTSIRTMPQVPFGPPPPAAPDAPTNLSGVAGDGRVTLAWDAPVLDGGTPLTDYYVEVFDAAGGTPVGVTGGAGRFIGSTATSFAFMGLTNGVAYTFTVSARNAAGSVGVRSARGPGFARHVFDRGGTLSVTQVDPGAAVQYLVVGGGGAGGGGQSNNFWPAGGGGGQVVSGSTTVTMGELRATVGISGQRSVLQGVAEAAPGLDASLGRGGRSGSGQPGGASRCCTTGGGGRDPGFGGGGGGGGDTQPGADAPNAFRTAGAGGAGRDLSAVWGTDVGDAGWFGGGGGGSQGDGNGTGAAGGRGGGGAGRSASRSVVTAGRPNTGGGGGFSDLGGSGVIVVGYPTGTMTASGGTVTIRVTPVVPTSVPAGRPGAFAAGTGPASVVDGDHPGAGVAPTGADPSGELGQPGAADPSGELGPSRAPDQPDQPDQSGVPATVSTAVTREPAPRRTRGRRPR